MVHNYTQGDLNRFISAKLAPIFELGAETNLKINVPFERKCVNTNVGIDLRSLTSSENEIFQNIKFVISISASIQCKN